MIYDIPILARGQIIAPGDDAVEFSGRGGARFRCPNPHRHINDLVLSDAGKLSDLHALPIAEIIDFLAALKPRLRMAENPHVQAAFDLALAAGGLTEPVLRQVYDDLPELFDRGSLEATVERTVGSNYMDGWVEQGEPGRSNTRVRAFGTRQLHITAGNVPIVAAYTVIRTALTKSDCLIKVPSNDPLTANAIVRTMIEMDADHPVTKHFAVAYWKGGDEVMEREIIRLTRIDKITAWGGMSSMKHIQKYLVPGLDLVSMNPKLSISIVGREGVESETGRQEAAAGIAFAAGRLNQTACSSTRVIYVESDTDDASIDNVIAFGEEIYDAIQALPERFSTPASKPDLDLEAELNALDLEEDFYWVKGDTVTGGVIVSRFPSPVDFSDKLNNRIVNLVPMKDISQVTRLADDQTQTVPVYPEALRRSLRDELGLRGAQRVVPLAAPSAGGGGELPGLPHDGIEPMRRMVRWVIDTSTELA